MKVILFTGDSHTMGEGAAHFKPSEHKMHKYMRDGSGFSADVEFENRGYVNRIREIIGKNSEAKMEWVGQAFSEKITLPFSGEGIYVTFYVRPGDAPLRAYLDGTFAGTLSFPAKEPRYEEPPRYDAPFCVYGAPFFCEDGEHVLEIEGEGYVENIQTARGEYMVINAAVGSCMAERYEMEHMPLLADLKPYLTVMEVHTINSWLGLSACIGAVRPEEYGMAVEKLINHGKKISEKVMAVSVSPVMGKQTGKMEEYVYDDYIRAAEAAIQRSGVPFADVHKAMTKAMEGMDEETKKEKFYANNWHVNDNGYSIYTEEILKILPTLL